MVVIEQASHPPDPVNIVLQQHSVYPSNPLQVLKKIPKQLASALEISWTQNHLICQQLYKLENKRWPCIYLSLYRFKSVSSLYS